MPENKNIEVGGRLHSIAGGNVLAGANEIFDDDKNKKQNVINAEVASILLTHSSAITGLNTQNYVTVTATEETTDVTDVLPSEDQATDTVYRVGCWNGTEFDESSYSEYAWNGSDYVHITTKTQIGEVFNISAYYASGGKLATYDDLTDALDGGNNIPQSLRKGGMSVKYVQSSDNKYVQYRLTSDTFTTNVSNWEEYNNNTVVGKTFYVTDYNGNIIAKIDKDGVHSVDFKIGEENYSVANALNNVATQIYDAVAAEEKRAKAVESTKLDAVLSDNAFYFTDADCYIIAKIDKDGVHSVNIDEEPNKIKNDNIVVTDNSGYIIFKIDNEGIHAPNLSEGGEVNSDNITIQDKNGYIVARIDKDGIHCAKDKHAVACMVLSENYYPTAAPTRDSDGNVTYVHVMFETGVTGSISITYTNGNSSSVAVVYGNYNYTITINRDSDGNVETVNVQ